MCGFCGFTGELADREQVIREMAERITHRGPDSEGIYCGDGMTMGFRRLSIIDLEAGNQPLYNEDKTLVLMCRIRPKTKREMLTVSGVGEFKYEKYGERFLECLKKE